MRSSDPAQPTLAHLTTASTLEPILSGLNEDQHRAVTHGDGPLLIVAGAGTGKTQVITRRIAWLIATKRARPEEILALTFTEKAAAEMEARVDVLVPYGSIGATVATFNAFGDRLVREHAVELGLTSQLRVESDAEIRVFLREHLFELELDRYLPLGRPDQHLEALLRVFDRARNEDVTPERYLAFAEELAASAGADPALADRAQAELEKARAYDAYQRLLHASGRVDFGSQIALALRLLRERPYLRREYQERIRYILVDEFQDTNRVQFELLRLLSGGHRNLAVVGDDDQSIYRFRGAKIENLLGFLSVFPDAAVTVLRRNYRSGQSILDRAHEMVRHNDPDRLEHRDPQRFDKHLIAERASEGVVEHRAFDSASDEAEAVAGEIAALIASGGHAPRELAVLARTHRQLDPFALALRARGIPFQRSTRSGLYRRPEVALCLDMLRVVADPDDGGATYAALGAPLFGADPVDLARLNAVAARRNRGLLPVALAALDREAGLDPRTVDAVRRFAALHAHLAARALTRPTSEVLYAFVTDSGLLGQLSAADTPEALEQVQNLNRLFGIVSRIGPLLRHDRVPQFMQHLELLMEAGDDPQAAIAETSEDAVQLLTVHNAKGLEFPVVFMVQLVDDRFPLRRMGEPLRFPAELQHAAGDPSVEHRQEERRLFYVGMTRARDRLILTHAADYGGKRAAKTSTFVVEALDLPPVPKRAQPPSAAESIARYAPAVEPDAVAAGALPFDQPLELSQGRIDDYLTCPFKYRYAHVVQLPLAGDPTAMFGIAMHHAIRVVLQHRMKHLPITVEAVIAVLEGAWSSEGFYTREHEERRLEEGRVALRAFVAREAQARPPLAVEMDFRFKVGHDVVRGRWDRIDETPAGIVLVDYKTGEIADRDKAEERARKSLKEDQLGLYALAYRETRDQMPARVELDFVMSGVKGGSAVTEDHLSRARDRIAEAAAGIRAGRFEPDPDQRKCGYCPYNRLCSYSAAR